MADSYNKIEKCVTCGKENNPLGYVTLNGKLICKNNVTCERLLLPPSRARLCDGCQQPLPVGFSCNHQNKEYCRSVFLKFFLKDLLRIRIKKTIIIDYFPDILENKILICKFYGNCSKQCFYRTS